ncbi:uncharacterized protein LOC131949154 [Physella acuta]|uniref:uncharacterized protein LOC131949154 n=1 Tax=Physella acuta TaxID=109671 RepID=UPI0027DB7B2F|nr:uncharacterized protein LOC131949154 [Physella acuta]
MVDHASTSFDVAETTNVETEYLGGHVHDINDLKNLVNTYNNIHQAVEIKQGHVVYLWIENARKVCPTVKLLEGILKDRQAMSCSDTTVHVYVRRSCNIYRQFRASKNWPQIVQFLERPFSLPHPKPRLKAKDVYVQEVEEMQYVPGFAVEKETISLKKDCPKCALKRKSTQDLVKANKKLKIQNRQLKTEQKTNKIFAITRLNKKIERLTTELEKQKEFSTRLIGIQKTALAKTFVSQSSESKLFKSTAVDVKHRKIKILKQAEKRYIQTIQSLKQELTEKDSTITQLKSSIHNLTAMLSKELKSSYHGISSETRT